MIEFCVLSSGSRANCLYVRVGETRILVDCGLSAAQTAKRLASIDVDPASITAVLITHEHRDHVAGVPLFSNRYKAMVYGNPKTLSHAHAFRKATQEMFQTFETGSVFQLGDMTVESFPVSHDAKDPVMFRLSDGSLTLGVVTDLGYVSDVVRSRVSGLDALILESNHDLDLLEEAPYSWDLKQRIRGLRGHLSNETASNLVAELCAEGADLQVLVAAHISENSNHPDLAVEGFTKAWQHSETSSKARPRIVAASVPNRTDLFQLEAKSGMCRVALEQKVGIGDKGQLSFYDSPLFSS